MTELLNLIRCLLYSQTSTHLPLPPGNTQLCFVCWKRKTTAVVSRTVAGLRSYREKRVLLLELRKVAQSARRVYASCDALLIAAVILDRDRPPKSFFAAP